MQIFTFGYHLGFCIQLVLGRFDSGSMSGIGLYVHPHGERYEGMFYSDKPDGPGSFYQKDPVLGKETASHAYWQLGRKQKELTTPFEPNKAIDLPDESMNVSIGRVSGHVCADRLSYIFVSYAGELASN